MTPEPMSLLVAGWGKDCEGSFSDWTVTIGALRFNPVNTDETSGLSGSVTIYSIRLVEKEDQGNSVPQTVTSWRVGKEGSLKDWKVSDAIATYSQDGSAVLTITGPDTQIKKEDLNIKAEDYQTLILTYVNHTKCKIGEAFFITDQQTVSGFQGNSNVGFIVEEGQNTVYIPFGEHLKLFLSEKETLWCFRRLFQQMEK